MHQDARARSSGSRSSTCWSAGAEGAGLDQEQHHVGRGQRIGDRAVQRPVQRIRVPGLEAGRVDVDELRVVAWSGCR